MTPLEVLQSAYEADPVALNALFRVKVPCNEQLADHPTVQVDDSSLATTGSYKLGVIGLINGILGSLGQPLLAAQVVVEGDAGWVRKVVGFQQYIQEESK